MALARLGVEQVETLRVNSGRFDKINDFHDVGIHYDWATGVPKCQVFQLTSGGPVGGPLSADLTITLAGYDFDGFCHFPGSQHGLYVKASSPGQHPVTVIHRPVSYDLGDQSVTVYTATQTDTNNWPTNALNESKLYGVTDTKAVLFDDRGNYGFFTRVGNVVTFEAADISSLPDPTGWPGSGITILDYLPFTGTTGVMVLQEGSDTTKSYYQWVTWNPATNSATWTGNLITLNHLSGWIYSSGCALTNDVVIACDWNDVNPDIQDPETRYNHITFSTQTIGGGVQYELEASVTLARKTDTTFIGCKYWDNDTGPTGRGQWVENYTVTGSTIARDNDAFLIKQTLPSNSVSHQALPASGQDWASVYYSNSDAADQYYTQLSGGGVPPSGEHEVTHSGTDVITFSPDGSLVFVALQKVTGEQIVVEAPTEDITDWTQSHIEAAGSLINVAPFNADNLIFYGQFNINVNVLSYDISQALTSDISPPSLGSAPVIKLEASPTEPAKILACVGGGLGQKIVKSLDSGATWADLITGIAFDPQALDGLWSGVGFPDRLFYGGTSGVAYTPNDGMNILDFTGPIVDTVTTITVQE